MKTSEVEKPNKNIIYERISSIINFYYTKKNQNIFYDFFLFVEWGRARETEQEEVEHVSPGWMINELSN